MVGHGPEMKNATERLGEIGFSIVRCLWRFPETTFIQPHWAASLGSKKKVDFASGAHGFPFKFFLASCTSSDASCLPFSTGAVTLLAVSSSSFCLLSSAPSGWFSSALCSQGTFFRSVLTFLFHPSDWFFLPLSTRYFSQILSSSKRSPSWQWLWTHLPTFSSYHKWLRMIQKRLYLYSCTTHGGNSCLQ